jgi:flavin reductase (DIM6/NTAB) family NADH-FMN oxidoreductase RutF
MLANSFTSVSLAPPLVSVNIARTSSTWPLLLRAKHLGISVLAEEQEPAFRQLSRNGSERFDGLDWSACGDGSICLTGASAFFTAQREAEVDAGDHLMMLLRVRRLHRFDSRAPLIFYAGQLGALLPMTKATAAQHSTLENSHD